MFIKKFALLAVTLLSLSAQPTKDTIGPDLERSKTMNMAMEPMHRRAMSTHMHIAAVTRIPSRQQMESSTSSVLTCPL
jgi:hypothetical protein